MFSPTVWGGFWGGHEGHTQEHTQERTRECCTYPLVTYPLKSARFLPLWARSAQMTPVAGERFRKGILGKSKRGLSKRGLGPKGANWGKKGLFGAISALPPSLWGAEELVLIGPEKARSALNRPRSALNRPQFAPKRPDFPSRISPRFSQKIWGLKIKPPFVSPRLDFRRGIVKNRFLESREKLYTPLPLFFCQKASSRGGGGCISKQVRIGQNRVKKKNRSNRAKCPLEHQIPREDASKSRCFFDKKKLHGGTPNKKTKTESKKSQLRSGPGKPTQRKVSS